MPFQSELIRAYNKNVDLFYGVFKPNGTGVVDNSLNFSMVGAGSACGFTVVRSATGVFTVTLRESYPGFLGAIPVRFNMGALGVECTTPPGALVNGVSFALQGLDAAGAASEVAAASNRLIGFWAILKAKGTVAGQ